MQHFISHVNSCKSKRTLIPTNKILRLSLSQCGKGGDLPRAASERVHSAHLRLSSQAWWAPALPWALLKNHLIVTTTWMEPRLEGSAPESLTRVLSTTLLCFVLQ